MSGMSRVYNGRPLELLAPAGTFDIFRDIIDSRCDAVYCGGRILNMRMIRKGYNLSNEELKEAVALAEERGKKVYITLNSLLDRDELSQAEEYLDFLQEIQPHGLIVQDAAVLELASRRNITLPLHSSVMMNVHNLDMIRFLEKHGVTRVVLSREMPLSAVRDLSGRTDMELEYFTHGDMCVTHGSQCLYSSWLFGMSSNRGRCLKPCRWPFSQPGTPGAPPFPLAVKDLNLYGHLSDMILAGISSFKIEGRMRQKEFITDLVNRYGEALDRFLEDPLGGARPDGTAMEPFTKRDYSSAYAFGNPGMKNINTRGEGTGKFYSTGKMFSEPTEELEIRLPEGSGTTETAGVTGRPEGKSPALSVRVNSLRQAVQALEYGPGRIYLSAEPFAPDRLITLEEAAELRERCRQAGCELYLSLPRMMSDPQNDLFRDYLAKEPPFDGILVSHSGAFEYIDPARYALACDASMNLSNPEAVRFYARTAGIRGWTSSLELPGDFLTALPAGVRELGCPAEGEVILHGRPTLMYMDHDISDRKADREDLVTPESRLTVRRDIWDRYHLLPHKELSLLPRLPELTEGGYHWFRLELQNYNKEEADRILSACRQALAEPDRGAALLADLKSEGGGYTYGAHSF